ncbi:hypothetical protein ACFQ1S_03895, partial [Kibdelosporangium lantanae]
MRKVDIDPGKAIVITIDIRSCRECNTNEEMLPDRYQPAKPRAVTVLVSKPNGKPPRVHTVMSDPAGGFESTKTKCLSTPSTSPPGSASQRTAVEWQGVVEPLVTNRIGAGNWQLVSDAWQPVHCSSLDAVADALDDIWATQLADVGRTVVTVDFSGLPAIPAALLVETALPWLTVGHVPSIAEFGGHLHTFAAICCAARGLAAGCAPL